MTDIAIDSEIVIAPDYRNISVSIHDAIIYSLLQN
jgi:hypothetical protein